MYARALAHTLSRQARPRRGPRRGLSAPGEAAAEAFERFGYDAAALATFRRARPHLTEPVEVAYCFAREAHALFDGLDDRDGAAAAWRSATARRHRSTRWKRSQPPNSSTRTRFDATPGPSDA